MPIICSIDNVQPSNVDDWLIVEAHQNVQKASKDHVANLDQLSFNRTVTLIYHSPTIIINYQDSYAKV